MISSKLINTILIVFFLINSSLSLNNLSQVKLRSNAKEVATSNNNTSDNLINYSKRIKISNFTNYNYIIEVSGPCDESTCGHGECKNNNTCVCDLGFAQLPLSSSKVECNYEMKSQLTAFFLELFLILGFGHLYIQKYLLFAIKFLVIVGLLLLDFLLKYLIKFKESSSRKTVYIFSYIFYSIIVVWQVIDVVMFGLNKYLDGNEMPLYVYEG